MAAGRGNGELPFLDIIGGKRTLEYRLQALFQGGGGGGDSYRFMSILIPNGIRL
jgi:hypothetical protein